MASRIRTLLNRFVLYPLEAAGAVLVYGFFRILPLDAASWLGGRIGGLLGPWLPVNRVARRNLERAFPEKSADEIAAILRGMWDNLGRVLGEWPHIAELRLYEDTARFTIDGAEYADLLRDDGRPGIFISAHLGNWEIGTLAVTQRGAPLDQVYRAANNPFVDRLIVKARRSVTGCLIRKGSAGARQLIAGLKAGHHLAIMIDQKMNDGIPVPFFGRPAMTASALVDFALRFDCPVVPGRVIRRGGARFHMIIEAPLPIIRTGDRHADLIANMTRINALFEGWIREHPEQWFWVHKRWPE